LDKFSFFFAFYGLILGLSVTEVLAGFAEFVRTRRLRELEWQTSLLALLVFLDICATWLDAYSTLRGVTLNFAGLAAPILVGTGFYLAASTVFPRGAGADHNLADYYRTRHGFVAGSLLLSEVFLTITFFGMYEKDLLERPAVFWLWHVPYKAMLVAGFIGLALAKQPRTNLACLSALLLLFTLPYWSLGAIPEWIHRSFDKADAANQG